MTDAGEARDLIFDWNLKGVRPAAPRAVTFDDETLRDGLQSPSAQNPKLEQKLEGLRRMARLGVAAVNLGLPSVSKTQTPSPRSITSSC